MVIAVVAGVLGGYWGQPWIHENERAINVIVTSFSILAGFLIAIMTIIGDPAISFWRSWRGYDRRPSGLGSAELKARTRRMAAAAPDSSTRRLSCCVASVNHFLQDLDSEWGRGVAAGWLHRPHSIRSQSQPVTDRAGRDRAVPGSVRPPDRGQRAGRLRWSRHCGRHR